ncbi:hypothetical protein F5884DRAFT_837287 [Xylogone sp. PMI_703]|nr:hypothetical protein F5884DRAFT_837287 [Xylogone sp. PMI_703]
MYFARQGSPNYCDPAYYPSSTDAGSQWEIYYYSPAQCPQGWSEATTFTSSFLGYHTSPLSLGSDTTAVLCCPSGYRYFSFGHQCTSGFADITTYLTFYSPILNEGIWTQGPVLTNEWAQGSSTWTIFGDAIPVWWQSSDLALFSPPTSTTTSSSSTSTGTSPYSISSSTRTTTNIPIPSQSTGLSSGAKIGIGVGIPLAAIAIGFIGFAYYIRWRRRNTVPSPELQNTIKEETPDTQELSGQDIAHEIYTDTEPPISRGV